MQTICHSESGFDDVTPASSPSIVNCFSGQGAFEVDKFGFVGYHILEFSALVGVFLLWLLWSNKERKLLVYKGSWQYVLPALAIGIAASLFRGIFGSFRGSLEILVNSSVDWYSECLEECPMITKSLTTGVIQVISDYFAQAVEGGLRIHHPNPSIAEDQSRRSIWKRLLTPYDFRRGLASLADGVILSGPLLHYAFEGMEYYFPTESNDGLGSQSMAVVIHVLINDYLVDTTYLFISFFFVAIAEGHIRNVWTLFRKDFLATVRASWGLSIMLMPVEYLCFSCLPVKLRVLSMNFIDILWSAVVSFVAHRSRPTAGILL